MLGSGLAKWVCKNVNTMQIKKPMAIVGTSLGGAVAIDFANAYPEAVKKLILFAPQVQAMLSLSLVSDLERTSCRIQFSVSFLTSLLPRT